MHNAAVCGRFTLTIVERRMVAEMLGVDPDSIPGDYRPRYNIAPTDPHFIVTSKYEQRNAIGARWGLVNSWVHDASRAAAAINAKAETIDTRAAFREASPTVAAWYRPTDFMNGSARRRHAGRYGSTARMAVSSFSLASTNPGTRKRISHRSPSR
jgi:hypothetical protein